MSPHSFDLAATLGCFEPWWGGEVLDRPPVRLRLEPSRQLPRHPDPHGATLSVIWDPALTRQAPISPNTTRADDGTSPGPGDVAAIGLELALFRADPAKQPGCAAEKFSAKPPRPFSNFGSRAGFTLLELLVVVAVIGILMALGMSGLSMANKKAKEAKGGHQMRQLALATLNFVNDNNGVFPDEIDGWHWDYDVLGYVAGTGAGVVPPYSPDLLHHPADPFVREMPRSYAINSALCRYFDWGATGDRWKGERIAKLQTPANTAMYLECFETINTYGSGNFSAAMTLTFRGERKPNVVFCDGSVRSFSKSEYGSNQSFWEKYIFIHNK